VKVTASAKNVIATKEGSKDKTKVTEFGKVLADKSSKIIDIKEFLSTSSSKVSMESLTSLIKQLTQLVSKISEVILKGKTGTIASTEKDTKVAAEPEIINNDLLALLSDLLSKLTKFQDTPKFESIAKPDAIAEKSNPKLIDLVSILKNNGTKMDISKFDGDKLINANDSKNIMDVKNIINVLENILVNVKTTQVKSLLKTEHVSKLETILKGLTKLVEDKTPVLVGQKTTNDKEANNQNGPNTGSQTKVDEDKLLLKISQKSDNTEIQKFSNLVIRASLQNNVDVSKVVEKVVINQTSVGSDVIKTVKFMQVNELKDLTVMINPKELGEVVIKLVQEGNAMRATITTANKEAYQLINSNLQEINNKITNNNLNIQSFSVDVFNGGLGYSNQDSQQNRDQNNNKKSNGLFIKDQEEDEIPAVAYGDSNLNILV